MSDIVIYSIGGLVLYQAYATIRVVRHKPYDAQKKRNQLLIIWLVPFIGAAAALAGLAPGGEAAARSEKKNR